MNGSRCNNSTSGRSTLSCQFCGDQNHVATSCHTLQRQLHNSDQNIQPGNRSFVTCHRANVCRTKQREKQMSIHRRNNSQVRQSRKVKQSRKIDNKQGFQSGKLATQLLKNGGQELEYVAQLSQGYDTPLYHNFISMTVGNKTASCLVDSGSTIDIADCSVLDKYPAICQTGKVEMPLKSQIMPPVQLPNGNTLSIVGKIHFPAILANKRVHLTFYLIKDFAYNFLLGYKTLEKLNAVISFGQRLFSINLTCNVVLKKPLKIPPKTEVITTGQVKDMKLPRGFVTFFEPKEISHEKSGYFIPESITRTDNNTIPITIANYNSHPIYLYRNTHLGQLVGIDDHNAVYTQGSANEPQNVNTLSVDHHSQQLFDTHTRRHPKTKSKPQQGKDNPYHISDVTGKHIPPISPQIDLSKSKINSKTKEKLIALLDEYRDVFSSEDNPIGPKYTKPYFEHDLKIKPDSPPITGKYYRTNPRLEPVVKHIIEDYITKGILEKSSSPNDSPVIYVRKPKYFGSTSLDPKEFRLVQDARELNKRLASKHFYPLPRCIDVIHNLNKSKNKIWSVLDLESAYYQISLSPKSRPWTASKANNQNLQWTVTVQGMANSGYYFQHIMDTVLEDLDFCQAYQDDISAGSDTDDQHLADLKQIFQRLRKHKLKVTPSKVYLFRDKLDQFGFTISEKRC